MKAVFEVYGIKKLANIPHPPPNLFRIPLPPKRGERFVTDDEVNKALEDPKTDYVQFRLIEIINGVAYYYAE